MLVKCRKYSTLYPDGSQNVGDVFELTKEQAEYYESLGWVEALPTELQPKQKRGKKKSKRDFAVDLSKSEHNGRYLEHKYTGK